MTCLQNSRRDCSSTAGMESEGEEQPPPRRELANIFASQAHVHVQAVWALAS